VAPLNVATLAASINSGLAEPFDPHHDAIHRARCRLTAAMPGAWESGDIA
jgi:hypothetical protein